MYRLNVQTHIQLSYKQVMTTAFVYLGVAGKFIEQAYAAQLVVRLESLSQLLNIIGH